ncbi:preprotein translocase subunit SecG [Mesomycoplasma conjunctivae]|uniref:Protein-export membrane protein SecG n=1 Tax=Mesomycoplasma conjunctivae (strain ATCC 25834 / NCTC 10147 / HRC/581) TaxID=572263 RepID=C5J793_MESCH|nr:preprotein translocase subunit SecG [Mesomycoplasma conjunctivae]CAT05356.1 HYPOTHETICAL PROTEIN MCJ_006620 [Mesomycoplasma conjunctivae]VEU66583.1 preprotein translocase subunit SecG [Mesomycoplasma conjunctivae]
MVFKTIILVIILIISVLMIIVSLLMSPHSNSFSGALIGSSDLDLFQVSKERSFKKFTKWTMFVLGILFMIIALLIRLL